MYFQFLIVFIAINFVFCAKFDRLKVKSGHRRVSRDTDSDEYPTINDSPQTIDCSKYGKPSNNTYCDQMIESLLVLVTGFPDSNQPQDVLEVTANDSVSNDIFMSPGQDPTVTKICCFLMSFQNARETCCSQIALFCDGISDQSDSCLCQGNTGTEPHVVIPPEIGGPDDWSTNPDDSSESGGFSFGKMIQVGYSMLKRVTHEIFENLTNNKK